MDTDVCYLEVACVKANSTWINDIGSKDLSSRPIYAVLNTHNLDTILQLKYMPRVMTGNPRNAMVYATPYLQNEFGDPHFFSADHFLF